MDVEAGASRYAVTVLLYLAAVTIYAVSEKPAQVPRDANEAIDSNTRGVEAWAI